MNLQTATALVPAAEEGGLHEIVLENGASLRARTLILSTGSRWRQMNVPGANDYRNKGLPYCPHCARPLFQGKRVAVVSGGNSGVEAPTATTGIVGHVTRIEYERDRTSRSGRQGLSERVNLGDRLIIYKN